MADETFSVRGYKIWLLTALLIPPLYSSRASEELPTTDFFFKSWETADGLPGNTVNRVVQDPRGFIWLANIGGLLRFDGVVFKRFDSPLIARGSARNIRALAAEDDTTLVMLPATGGVVRWRDGNFSAHPVSAALEGWSLQTLFVDPGGALWIGAPDGRIARWKNGYVTKFGAADGFRGVDLRPTFTADRSGRVWIGAGDFFGYYFEGKVSRFSGKIDFAAPITLAASATGGVWISQGGAISKLEKNSVVAVITDLPWTALHGSVEAMMEDHEGVLWIGTRAHGLFRVADGKLYGVSTSQKEIRAIFEDRDGAIWVGTAGGGLNRLRPRLFRFINQDSGLPEQVSAAVSEAPSGDVWLANHGGGLVRVRHGEIQLPKVQFDGHLLEANTLCSDTLGRIWFGADTVYRYDPAGPAAVEKSDENIPRVNVLFHARNGDIWVGAEYNVLGRFRGGDLRKFTREIAFSGSSVRAIAEDPFGEIWVGTERGDIFVYSAGKFTHFGAEAGLTDAPVRTLYADDDGNVWVGTIGAGLVLWRQGKFVRFTPADGLPTESISEILEDDNGRLWLGSLQGMSYVPKQDLLAFPARTGARIHGAAFNEGYGLPKISCYGSSQPMAWKGRDGLLWFGTQQGVLAVDADALKFTSVPPAVYVDSILVNDQMLASPHRWILPPMPRKIEFRFAVPSYAAPDAVKLRFRLEGVDSEWVETSGRAAIYGQLPPGTYRLRASACNNDGHWNERETVIKVEIPPVWWETVWARISALVLFTAGVILGVRRWSKRKINQQLRLLEREQGLERERSRIARDLHDDLGSSLTQIGLMLEELRETSALPEEFKAQSGVISGRVRHLAQDLNSVVWTINPKNDSLPDLVDFLSRYFLQNLRLSTIRPRLEVMDDLPARPLSPEARHHLFLVVKEGLNNVIKHSSATEATLTIRFANEEFEVVLRDDGVGFAPHEIQTSNRHGLQNMRSRIVELGGAFEVTTVPGAGTRLNIRIPVPTVPLC